MWSTCKQVPCLHQFRFNPSRSWIAGTEGYRPPKPGASLHLPGRENAMVALAHLICWVWIVGARYSKSISTEWLILLSEHCWNSKPIRDIPSKGMFCCLPTHPSVSNMNSKPRYSHMYIHHASLPQTASPHPDALLRGLSAPMPFVRCCSRSSKSSCSKSCFSRWDLKLSCQGGRAKPPSKKHWKSHGIIKLQNMSNLSQRSWDSSGLSCHSLGMNMSFDWFKEKNTGTKCCPWDFPGHMLTEIIRGMH